MLTKKIKWLRNTMAFGAVLMGVIVTAFVLVFMEPKIPLLLFIWVFFGIYLVVILSTWFWKGMAKFMPSSVQLFDDNGDDR